MEKKTDTFPWKTVEESRSIAISGHIRPDGDCVGSTLALYLYLQENYNRDGQKRIDYFLQEPPKEFRLLSGLEKLDASFQTKTVYDLYFSLDCGSIDRLGEAEPLFRAAKTTVSLDHHRSNTAFAAINLTDPEASSTSELLFRFLDPEKISTAVAEALYVGIVHDTGCFRHACTSPETMRTAAVLLEKNIRANELTESTFYQKTYHQNQILGRCLLESILLMDGKVIVSGISQKMLDFYKGVPSDTDGVIDLMRSTAGVEVAILLREEKTMCYKVSMRSNSCVDVSRIAKLFGGGGHIRAAGCLMNGTWHDVINNLTGYIAEQLKAEEEGRKRF